MSLREIGNDLLRALFHFDRSAFSLFRELLVHPGTVALNYVSGKRKRYFGPFAFLVVIVAIASAAIALSGFRMVYAPSQTAGAEVLQTFLAKHVNLMFFVEVPLLAAACRLLGPRGRFNYAEYLVLASYTSGMRILLFVTALVSLWFTVGPSAAAVQRCYFVCLLVWFGYFGFAFSQFLPGRRWPTAFRGVAAAALAYVGFAAAATAAASILLPK